VITQHGRQITPTSETPSPLFFVTAGEPRVEIIRGGYGFSIHSYDPRLKFSLDGGLTYPYSDLGVPPDQIVFAKYTPNAISRDALQTLAFFVNSTPYHCEALELTQTTKESQHTKEILDSIPDAYQNDSMALNALAKAIAWGTYPLRVLMQKADVVNDPNLTPGHALERLRELRNLPDLTGIAVQTRRQIIANATRWYQYGGSSLVISEIIETLTGITFKAIGTGLHSIELRISALPIDTKAFEKLVRYWIPAWVQVTFFYGYYTDGEVFADGSIYADGVRF
jgi:hypothetical protein